MVFVYAKKLVRGGAERPWGILHFGALPERQDHSETRCTCKEAVTAVLSEQNDVSAFQQLPQLRSADRLRQLRPLRRLCLEAADGISIPHVDWLRRQDKVLKDVQGSVSKEGRDRVRRRHEFVEHRRKSCVRILESTVKPVPRVISLVRKFIVRERLNKELHGARVRRREKVRRGKSVERKLVDLFGASRGRDQLVHVLGPIGDVNAAQVRV